MRLRNHVLTCSSRLTQPARPVRAGGALTIVLVGGGPTGVEMAGALSELIGHNLATDFHHLDVTKARVMLVEMTDHLLPGFSPAVPGGGLADPAEKGIEVRFGTTWPR